MCALSSWCQQVLSSFPVAAVAGFVRPSPVQAASIPLGQLGCDLVVQAKSGTGKTLSFATIVLLRVSDTSRLPQACIVVPTREVAVQVADVVLSISSGYPHKHVGCFIGGQVTCPRCALLGLVTKRLLNARQLQRCDPISEHPTIALLRSLLPRMTLPFPPPAGVRSPWALQGAFARCSRTASCLQGR